LLDKIALTLVRLVTSSAYHGDLGLSEVREDFLMVDKHLDRVGQDLRQLQVADMTAQGHCAVFIICILLELSECLQTGHQTVSLLSHVIKLMRQEKQVSEELDSELGVSISKLAIGT